MMNIERIRELYLYNTWAYDRVLACVESLTEEQFIQPNEYSVGSVHQQLVHSMSAEWIWLSRLNSISPTSMFHAEDYPTLELILAKWHEIHWEFETYLTNLKEEDLASSIKYNTTEGNTNSLPIWGILTHVVTHAMNHRAQILKLLHEFDAPTVEMDLFVYLLEKSNGTLD